MNQIPWAEEGFYYDDKIDRPGRNPLHEAGAYYLQEPSAMSVIPKADIKEGEKFSICVLLLVENLHIYYLS